MDKATITKLNTINYDFYRKVAPFFDKTRQVPWEGWDKAFVFLESLNFKANSILDIGCGNGRFARFIEDQKISSVNQNIMTSYIGIDSADFLLEKAQSEFSSHRYVWLQYDLLNHDFELDTALIPLETDLIVCFGVMHHIPGRVNREKLLTSMIKKLSPQGKIVLSFWNFKEDGRLNNKILDWEQEGLSQAEVEPNDYLLSWDKGVFASRYCHYHPTEEIQALIKVCGGRLIHTFEADGKSGKLNTYIILEKETDTPYTQ